MVKNHGSYLNVDCMISQTLSLVRSRPTGDTISSRRRARIFIRTTSSELGSRPTNLQTSEIIKMCKEEMAGPITLIVTMTSYLTGRSPVCGKQSTPVNLNFGTPQGSRLSLFVILMADLGLWTEDMWKPRPTLSHTK